MNLIRTLAVRSYRKELIQYTDMLSSLDEDKVAIFLVYGVWLRSILQLEGHINPMKQVDPSHTNVDLEPELHAYPLMLKDFIDTQKILDKQKNTAKSLGLNLWVHTLRSIIRPELRVESVRLWELILKSKLLWNDKLEHLYREDIRLGIGKEFVERTLKLSESIVTCLPPKQLFQS